jgi:phage shock protein PspC (stress-responsive transcriptional regulator)
MNKTFALSKTDRIIAGVCGGLAEYFDFNATLVRILFVITTFFGFGAPILIYAVLFIIMKFR